MPRNDIPKAVREMVLDRDSFDGCPCCIWCGKPFPSGYGLTEHHVKRRSQGGENKPENLVALCGSCHLALHSGQSEIQEYCKAYLKEHYECI